MHKRSWMAAFRHGWQILLSMLCNDTPTPRTNMPRHVKIGLIVLGLALAIAVGFFVDVVGRVQLLMKNDKETEENPFKAPPQPLYAPTDPPLAVKVFFPETN